MASGSQNNTSYQAQKWTNLRAFTIGNTNKDVDGTSNMSWSKDEILGASTNAYFLRGDKAWSDTLNNTFTANGDIIANEGYLEATLNNNTIQIGSQNANYCHITNTANIPFWFNQEILMEKGKTIGAAGTVYRPFQIYLGRNTTAESNALNATSPLIEFSNSDRSQYCQLIYTDYDTVQAPDSLTLVGNQDGITFICKNGPIWVQGGSNAGGNVNRLTTSTGMPGNMQYNTSRRGTQIYSNGIAFADPYNGNSNSDAGWIRQVETTGNTGYLEIGVGDDGNEEIIVRQYKTDNTVGRQMYLLNSAGFTTVSNQSTDSSYSHAAMQIREANYAGASSDTWGVAPRLAWHWLGRVAAQIGLASNGYLYEAPATGTSFYKLVYESGTWGISISGNAASASKVGEAATWLYFNHSNEVNFGGTGTSDTIYFGYRATDSRPKPATFIFGTSSAMATVKAATFVGALTGNASTASKITDITSSDVAASTSTQRYVWFSCNDNKTGRPSYSSSFTFQTSTGTLTATKVKNAVWNDYAECRKVDTIEPGYCVIETSSGTMTKSTKRLQPGCKLTSDTFGTCMGETDEAKTPIAVAGRVLAYPYRDIKEYELGAAVCSAPNGTIDIMTREEIMMYPERIVGTVSEIPTYETWYGGTKENPTSIPVNGRIWIYVR